MCSYIFVSSLYGRVYRSEYKSYYGHYRFLPIREGVSAVPVSGSFCPLFPPYTGGCIGCNQTFRVSILVSSLYGRVYRIIFCHTAAVLCFIPIREGVSKSFFQIRCPMRFPPYTGGCIRINAVDNVRSRVSSLYGRVYRKDMKHIRRPSSFLPIREGVSMEIYSILQFYLFPPCTGGCIIHRRILCLD